MEELYCWLADTGKRLIGPTTAKVECAEQLAYSKGGCKLAKYLNGVRPPMKRITHMQTIPFNLTESPQKEKEKKDYIMDVFGMKKCIFQIFFYFCIFG